MKLAEFQKTAAPSSFETSAVGSVPDTKEGTQEEPQYVTSTTPSGIEVYYSWAPRRHYKLRQTGTKTWGDLGPHDWQEVPSVTNVLSVLDKSGALTWWGMKVGIEGVVRLCKEHGEWLTPKSLEPFGVEAIRDGLVESLTDHKLTVNHVKDKAADRGVNVHSALEFWCKTGTPPQWDDFPETESGYVKGMAALLAALGDAVEDIEAEVMVGSAEHQFAGRCDLTFRLTRPVELTTRVYPKLKPKIEEIPAGRYLLDLKTSKRVYDTHYLQLEAYEHAAIECGYAPTDYRGVVHVTEDGRYELALNKDWCFEDFLAVRKTYQVMNEREVLRILREELDAKEIG